MERILKFGSVSSASRARRILLDGGVKARLTKTDTSKEGCGWGLTVRDEDLLDAARILRGAGLSYEGL